MSRMQDYYRANGAAQRDRVAARREGGRDPSQPWPEGHCSYQNAHERVRVTHGPAKRYPCVTGCGRVAAHWAYQGGAVVELTETRRDGLMAGKTVTYSPDPADYAAMCVPCHTALDKRG